MSGDDALRALGWRPHFARQVAPEEAGLVPLRIATVHRARMSAQSPDGPVALTLPAQVRTSDFAVGDWVLAEPETHMLVRRLERHALLQRRTEGGRGPQLIAANVDALLIVTSCNEDFNPARLERYLALANEAGTQPVIVLTKADLAPDADDYAAQARELQRGLAVVSLNAKSAQAAEVLAPWCGPGQTVALVGSSGVGKSTLSNTLSAKTGEDAQATGAIRADDAKGRHTTTARSLHRIARGGWVIDTPGIRTLHLGEIAGGIDAVFAEIAERAPQCHFRDCTHAHEPGCAVQAGIEAGEVSPERLARWRKLMEENDANTETATGARGNKTPPRRKKR